MSGWTTDRWRRLGWGLGVLAILIATGSASAGVRYRGNAYFSSRELDERFEIDSRTTPPESDLIARLPGVLSAYARAGYWDATIRVLRSEEDLVVEIDEGERVEVAGQSVTGAPSGLVPTLEEGLAVQPGRPLSETELSTDLERSTRLLAEEGYPFAEAEAMDFVRDGDAVTYRLRITPGQAVRVDSLRIRGLDVTRPETVWRIARFTPGEPYRESTLRQIQTRLSRSGIFARVDAVDLKLLPGSDRGVYDVMVEEAPSTIVHGVIGVGGTDQELTGLLDVALTNLFGTARAFAARWQGRGNGRATYEVSYREPWILGWPLAMSGTFYQDQEDTLFTRTEWLADVEFALTERFALRGGWQSEETVTPGQFVRHASRQSTRFGIRWDDRGILIDPRRGNLFDVLGTRGTQRETRITEERVNRDVTTLEALFESRFPTSRNDGVFLRVRGYLRDAPGETLRPENLYPIGGTRSLRGYEERQFRTGQGGVVTWEARRYLRADGSRFFLFVDAGYLDPLRSLGTDGDPWKLGAGFGFRVMTRLGLLGVDLAASEDIESYEEVRLHMSVEGRY